MRSRGAVMPSRRLLDSLDSITATWRPERVSPGQYVCLANAGLAAVRDALD